MFNDEKPMKFGFSLFIPFCYEQTEPVEYTHTPLARFVNSASIIPIGSIVKLVGGLIVSLILLISYKSKNHIVIEILSIVLLQQPVVLY